jgi:dynein heavy chain
MLCVPQTRVLMEWLEEACAALGALLGSKHARPFAPDIKELAGKFTLMADLLDIWLGVQHIWRYVGVAFHGEDVAQQLPLEAKRFEYINSLYIRLMQEAFSNCYLMMLHSNGESLRLRLVEIRDQLEISQRCLTGYLDTKRQAFPRMFFVSDTILLESLSYTLEADAMKPLLIPLFDNVRGLMLHPAKPSLLVGIVSEEGEELAFDAPISATGAVELLLSGIHGGIRDVLQAAAGRAATEGVAQLQAGEVGPFLQAYHTQICVLGMQFWWSGLCGLLLSRGEELSPVASAVQTVGLRLGQRLHPPPPPPRTKWTRRVPRPVLIGHAASLTPY